MKPAAFAYHPMKSLAETTALLAELGEEGRILAGGQSLVPLMNFRLAQPSHVVDINGVTELAYIRRSGDRIAIGALQRFASADAIRVRVAKPGVAIAASILRDAAVTVERDRADIVHGYNDEKSSTGEIAEGPA